MGSATKFLVDEELEVQARETRLHAGDHSAQLRDAVHLLLKEVRLQEVLQLWRKSKEMIENS